MQPVRRCIFSYRPFEETVHPLGQEIWSYIWKRKVEKSQTNATNVTLPLLGKAIWGHIWKITVEKSQTNATNVITHHLRQYIWGSIRKRIVDNIQRNVISVILHPTRQAIWGPICIFKFWQLLVKTNATSLLISIFSGKLLKETLENAQWTKTYGTSGILHQSMQVHCTMRKL